MSGPEQLVFVYWAYVVAAAIAAGLIAWAWFDDRAQRRQLEALDPRNERGRNNDRRAS